MGRCCQTVWESRRRMLQCLTRSLPPSLLIVLIVLNVPDIYALPSPPRAALRLFRAAAREPGGSPVCAGGHPLGRARLQQRGHRAARVSVRVLGLAGMHQEQYLCLPACLLNCRPALPLHSPACLLQLPGRPAARLVQRAPRHDCQAAWQRAQRARQLRARGSHAGALLSMLLQTGCALSATAPVAHSCKLTDQCLNVHRAWGHAGVRACQDAA